MRPHRLRWLLPCVLSLALHANAAPVEYGTLGGRGTMLLDREGRSVNLDVLGVNGHSCSVRGRLSGQKLDRVEAEEGCKFQLQPKAQAVLTVVVDEAARDACRSNCGARAWFEGDYQPLPAACTQKGLARQQGDALRAYQGKRFDDAFRLWSQGLADCETTMHWSAIWRWRNDASIAAAHAGHAADCTRLSQAVLADVKRFTLEGETEPFTFAPGDAETARPLISAARHNLARCDAKP